MRMKILLIGSGGSTHALAWKFLLDNRIQRVYCAPGNGGTSLMTQNVPYTPGRPKDLASWAWDERMDLTLVADDAALADGVVQAFRFLGLTILAPGDGFLNACTSRSEARALCARLSVPTLPGVACDDVATVDAYVADASWPLRLRPDGVYTSNWTAVARHAPEAHQAAQIILGASATATATAKARILVEEYVGGIEASASAFVTGKDVGPAVLSYTHRHHDDGGQGLRTDGLGAYSPLRAGLTDPAGMAARIRSEGLEPLARTLDYRGVLHLDVLLTLDGGWRALGLRATFGDPEAQVILPRLTGELLDALDGQSGPWSDEAACGVVLATDEYPRPVGTALPITGLDTLDPGVLAFHDGTALSQGRRNFHQGFSPLAATGGRVLTVVGRGKDVIEARGRAYRNIGRIRFTDSYHRTDIAAREIVFV
jgi:phosphoribosylamine--glycine ligase